MLVHKHLIVRAEVKHAPVEWELRQWVEGLIPMIGMKLLKGPISEYVWMPGNKGATCIAIIETSHIAVHVWDEPDPALMQIDVYSCGPLDPAQVLSALETFNPVKVHWKFLDRENDLIEVDAGSEIHG